MDGWGPDTGPPDFTSLFDRISHNFSNLVEIDNIPTIINEGNRNNIKHYVEHGIHSTAFGKLFVAPCGLGKTKFAPGLLMSKLGFKQMIMLTERIASANSAYDWYDKQGLEGIDRIVLRAGGKSRSKGDGNRSLKIMTTNAFVDSKTKVASDTLVLLDEAHNITSGTIAVMRTVPKEQLVRATATPVDEGFKLDLCTPRSSRIEFRAWAAYDVVEHFNKSNKSALVIMDTINRTIEMADDITRMTGKDVIVATGEGVWKGKTQLTISQLDTAAREPIIIVATDILQESVTLPIGSVWDCGRRVRPCTNVRAKLDSAEAHEINWEPDHLIVDITWPEVGQVAGRVGRTDVSDGGLAVIDISTDLPRRHHYQSESRDGIPRTADLRIPTDKIRKTLQYKATLAAKMSAGDATREQRKTFYNLDFIDFRGVMYELYEVGDALVASMFGESKIGGVGNRPSEQQISEPKRVDTSNLTFAEAVKSGAKRITPSPSTIDPKKMNPKSKDINLSFGEIDVGEMKKIANKRKSGTRGYGQGMCYLQLLGYRKRAAAARIMGPNPALHELAFKFHLKHSKRLLFRSPNVAHVVDADEFNIGMQLSYLASIGKKVFVGCDSEEMVTEVQRLVTGEGDCWSKLPNMTKVFMKDGVKRTDVTAEELAEALDQWMLIETAKVWVKFTMQEDGDFHVEKCVVIRGNNKKLRDKQPPGCVSLEDFIDELNNNKTRIVGDGISALTNSIKGLTSPTVIEAVDNAMSNDIIDEIAVMRNLCPFKIPKESVEYFNTLGIPNYADAPREHSHPVHYAIRRNKLVNVIPKYISCDFTAINMKPNHFDELKAHSGQDGTNVSVIRGAKDFARFGGNLAKNPFELPRIRTPVVILDQLAHYMSAQDILQIGERNPEIVTFVAGHEFPVSALFASASPLPHLWQHRVEGKTLFYKCEQDESEPYQQPFDPSLLLARTLRDSHSKTIWYCQVVHSHLNSHTQIITRIPLSTDDYLPVQMHDFIELMPVHRDRFKADLVPRTLYDRMMDYAQSMPNLKANERRAKLRQLLNPEKFWIDEETKEELIEVVDTIVRHSACARINDDKFYDSFASKIKYNTIDRMAKWVDSQFRRKYIRRWRAIARAEHPLKLIPLSDLVGERPSQGSIFKFKWTVRQEHAVSFWYTFRSLLFRYLQPEQFSALEKSKDWLIDGKQVAHNMQYLTLNHVNREQYSDEEFMDSWVDAVRRLYNYREPRRPPPPPPPKLVLRKAAKAEIQRDEELERVLHDVDIACFWDDPFDDANAVAVQPVPGDYPSDTDSERSVKMGSIHSSVDAGDSISLSGVNPEWKPPDRKIDKGKQKAVEIVSHSDTDVGNRLLIEDGKVFVYEPPEAVKKLMKGDFDDFDKSLPSCSSLKIRPKVDPDEEAMLEALEVSEPAMVPSVNVLELPESKDDMRDQRELFTKIVASNVLDFSPIRNSKPWELWWDDEYPITSGKRYSKSPYIPVRKRLDYPKQDCLLASFSSLYNALSGRKLSRAAIWAVACRIFPKGEEALAEQGLSAKLYDGLCVHFNLNVAAHFENGDVKMMGVREGHVFKIEHENRHWKPFAERKPLVILDTLSVRPPMEECNVLLERLQKNPLVNFKSFKPDVECADKYLFHLIHKRVGTFHHSPLNEEKLVAWDKMMKAQLRLEEKQPKERYMSVIMGDPGCGKSKPIADILRDPKFHKLGVFQVSLPVGELRDDWAEKIGVRTKKGVGQRPTNQAMCCTFEYALAKTAAAYVLIVDEDKFPTGYISLMCLLKPAIKYVIFLGDPFQGSWHDAGNSAGALNALPGEMERYAAYSDYFIIGTQRFGENMGNIMCTPVRYEAEGGGIRFAKRLPVSWSDLKEIYPQVSDQKLKAWWNNQASLEASHASVEASAANNRNEVMTMASSQGLTKDLVILHINQTVLNWVGYDILWVALSRAHRVVIYWSMIEAGKIANSIISNPALSVLSHYRAVTPQGKSARPDPTKIIDFRKQQGGIRRNWKVVLAFPPGECSNWDRVKHHFPDLSGYLENGKFVPMGGAMTLYRDIDHNDEGHKGNPYIATRTRGYRYAKLKEIGPPVLSYPAVPVKTKLTKAREGDYVEYVNAQVSDKYSREIWHSHLGYSIQAPEGWLMRRDAQEILKSKAGKNATKGMSTKRTRAILLQEFQKRHPRDNPMLYSTAILNWGLDQKSSDETSYAAMMVERVRRSTYLANRIEYHHEVPYGDYLWESFAKYLGWVRIVPFDEDEWEKSDAVFTARRAARSSALKSMGLARASPDFTPIIVAKTQIKLKSTTIKDASALQTTLTMEDDYLFKFGKVGVYLLTKILEHLPPYVYFHAKKTFADMTEFVRANYLDSYWESDLTQQEQSMRGGFLQFFLRLMDHFKIPGEYIDALREMKLNTVVGRMTLALMTASGEIFTWLYNTCGNAARIAAKYNLKPGDAGMFTGDDSLVNRLIRERKEWSFYKAFDHATEKSSHSYDRGTFAGYVVKQGCIFKNPEILLRKFMVAASQGRVKDVIHGYFIEWCTVYSHSDLLHDLLTEVEMDAHTILSNKIFNSRREFKVNVKFGWDRVVSIDPVINQDMSVHQALIDNPSVMEEMTVPMTTAEYFTEDDL